MKIFWFILILFLASSFVRSQEYLNEILPREGQHGLWGLMSVEEVGSGYWVNGAQYHTSTGKGSGVLIKLNNLGQIDTTIFVTSSDAISITTRMLIHNDFIYVLTNYLDEPNTNIYKPLLVKYDLNGNELWRQVYDEPTRLFVNNIMVTSDNHLILSGSIRTHPTNDFPRCFFIRKVNLDGEEIWNQTYWPSFKATSNQVIETSDGGLMISGQSQRHFTNEFQFRVIKTDVNGAVVWDKDLGVDGHHNGGGNLSELPDGSFLGTSAYELSNELRMARYVFFDSEGNILRENAYQFGNYGTFSESVVLDDGTLVVRGIGKNQFNEQYINLLKFDPMGNLIWQHEYTNLPDWPSIAYTLKKTENNGILFAGSTWVETDVSFQQRAWLVKTDCFGCDSLLCYYEDSTCMVYDCNEYPTSPQFTVSNPIFSTSTGTTFTFTQNQTSNTTMRYWDLGDGTTQMGAESITHTYTQAGTYLVKLRSHHSACYDEFEQTVVVTQNIGESYANDGTDKEDEVAHVGLENWEQGLKIYPNPAEKELFVEFPNIQGTLSIVDLLGKEVLPSAAFDGYAYLDLSNLSSGVYVLKISDGLGGFWNRQVVVK